MSLLIRWLKGFYYANIYPLIHHPTLMFTLLVAGGNDILDYMGIGAVPITGDLLDIAVSGSFFLTGHTLSMIVSLFELYPGVDFLPVHTISWFIVYMKVRMDDARNRFGV
jgi:hypothetical protein